MRSRNGLDWTERFRAIAEAAGGLAVGGAMLDGEVVALERPGEPVSRCCRKFKRPGFGATLSIMRSIYCSWRATICGAWRWKIAKACSRVVFGGGEGPIRYPSTARDRPADLREAMSNGPGGHHLQAPLIAVPVGAHPGVAEGEVLEREEFVIGGFTKPTTRRGASARCRSAITHDGKLESTPAG